MATEKSIYIVVENGESYPEAYSSYELAAGLVRNRYKEYLESGFGEKSIVDVEESANGTTDMYIHDGIYIKIYRLPLRTKFEELFGGLKG